MIAGYNTQIAVDGAHQIIVAQRLQTSPTDARALAPPFTDIRAVLRTNPKGVSADAGYCDEKNLAHLARRRIAAYLAPGRARHSQTHCRRLSPMAQRLAQGRDRDKTQARRPA